MADRRDAGAAPGASRDRAVLERLATDHEPERSALAAALVVAAAAAGVAAIPPLVVRRLIDDAIPGAETGLVNVLVAALVAAPLVAALMTSAAEARFESASRRIASSLRERALVCLRREAAGRPGDPGASGSAARAANALEELSADLGPGLSSVVVSASVALASMLGAVLVAPVIGIVSVALVPVTIALVRRDERVRAGSSERLATGRTQLRAALLDAVSPSAGDADRERERLAAHAHAVEADAARDAAARRRAELAGRAVAATAVALVWLAGAHRVAGGPATLGGLVAVVLFQMRLFSSARSLSDATTRLRRIPASAAAVYECLDAAPPVGEAPGARSLRRLQGGVVFDGVTVPGDDGLEPLREVSFEVPPDRVLAVVSPPRAGGRSIGPLLTRRCDPDAGAVLLDGWDLRELTLETIARAVRVFDPAEPKSVSIREHLLDARPGATEAQIAAAARAAQIYDDVVALPDGFDSRADTALSAPSQRVRLETARMLLVDPRVVVLDEPPRAVDAREERRLERALAALVAGRTAIVLPQRRATLEQAEQVIVLDGGRVAERGPHAELLAAGGLYARIFRERFSGEPRIADVIA